MQLKCEYCGAMVDTKEDEVCPFCGASYDGNKEYEEKRAREEESKRIILERRKLDLERRKMEHEEERIEHARRIKQRAANPNAQMYSRQRGSSSTNNAAGGILIKMFVIFVMAFIFIIGSFIFTSKSVFNAIDDDYTRPEVWNADTTYDWVNEENLNTEEYEGDIATQVGFNEVAKMEKYTIVCDTIEVRDLYPYKPTEGYQYVNFRFIITNTSDDDIITESVLDCLADGIMCKMQYDTERTDIPPVIDKGAFVEGNVCYEVPIDTEVFDIMYGENVTIHIENTLGEEMNEE